jgi:YHS domain-containing protein
MSCVVVTLYVLASRKDIHMFKRPLIALMFLAGLAGNVLAGPQYIDDTGFAISGYDAVAYFNSGPQAGKKEFTTTYNGAKFAFSTAENLAAFQANPGKYAPTYDGHCAYGVAQGGKVPGNPNLWKIVDGHLYLNITKNVQEDWEADIPGNLKKSTVNWETLESKDASTRVIPAFSSTAPN